MILHLEGNVNPYYVQTLAMIFFPGATFGIDEVPGEGVAEVTVKVYPDGEGACSAYAAIKLNDRVSEATETISYEQPLAIATHESIAVGRAMFAAGKELLGHTPPWGILTGIRPAKVAAALLDGGKGVIKTKRILRDEYFLNPQKASLATSVASTEIKLLKKLPERTCSLYISVPFCPSRCAYCSFVSYTSPKLLALMDDYLENLIEDIKSTVATIRTLGLRILTVYVGGGTPTMLSAEALQRLLSTVRSSLREDEVVEFTLEAGRPDTITAEKLAVARRNGVTRVCVNPQSLCDDVLREIGRKHTIADFYRAFALAKESGIPDINVDLIAGLPGDDFKTFSETIDRVIELAPSNITVHTFCVKKAADVLKNNTGIYALHGADAAKSVSYSQLKTKFAGYRPYYMYRQKNTVGNLENVGYSLEGREGLYNVLMMEEKQTIFAVGAGAVTKLVAFDGKEGTPRIKRIFQPKYPYEYLRDDRKKRLSHIEEEAIRFFGIPETSSPT